MVNFALMRRDVFGHVLWDPQLKVTEHADFYLRLREAPYSVLHTPDVSVDHPLPAANDADYAAYRSRAEFAVRSMLKHDLTRVETIGGLVVELCDDRLTIDPGDGSGEIVIPR